MSDEIKIFAPIFFQKFYLVTFFRKEWAGLYFILLDLRKTTMNIFFPFYFHSSSSSRPRFLANLFSRFIPFFLQPFSGQSSFGLINYYNILLIKILQQ